MGVIIQDMVVCALFTLLLKMLTHPSDRLGQFWSILPAMELLPSTGHAADLRIDQLRGSNSNAGNMDQTWSTGSDRYASLRNSSDKTECKSYQAEVAFFGC